MFYSKSENTAFFHCKFNKAVIITHIKKTRIKNLAGKLLKRQEANNTSPDWKDLLNSSNMTKQQAKYFFT